MGNENIKEGSVVYSKKYDCKATIHSIRKDEVLCFWFDDAVVLHSKWLKKNEIAVV